ncbi:PREDICTED: histone H4 transcription factor-like [Eufriesea mexicana]|uniref:histone H4 transcription factor-like n=1 Tax=Eufriesea mexicana TaxID=516756 RepID=UPI00083C3221|nr:PREDICTED: histone H4 transcription factor-like [Eufriesea mexicana]
MAEFTKNLITSKDVQKRCDDWVESQKVFTYTDETQCKRKQTDDDDSYNTDSEFDSVSECGTKRRRVGLPLKREVYHLCCEWTGCKYEANHVERFVNHVAAHVSDLNTRTNEKEINVYVCQWSGCLYESNDPDEISRHVNYHAYHTKLKCIGSNIRTRIKLPKCRRDSEWKNVIDLPAPLLCRWEECLKHFRNYQLYLYHVAAHIEEGPRGNKIEGGLECKWTGCGNLYPSLYKLRDHIRRHTKEKIVACPDCGATFASNTKFHVHCKRQIPIDVQGFQCSHCNKFYPTEGILRDHMRMHVFNYKCSLCDMSCESPASLAKHVRYRHVSTRSFPCQLCSHAAKSQQDLDSHMTVHTNGPNFLCHFEGCLYKCKGAYTLDRHIERVHSMQVRWYCCHECPIKYRKSYRLTKHLIETHQLQLPSGHTRFQYIHDEDGCYRLQMVRYEAVEEETNPSITQTKIQNRKFKIKLNKNCSVPQVEIFEDLDEEGEEDEETKAKEKSGEKNNGGKSMPVISNILISIDETDAEGNIIRSRVVEAQETMELPPSEGPLLILT